MKLKVCGQKHNIQEVAALRPDYIGFIFWPKSSRYFEGEIPPLAEGVKKIGVFVNANLEYLRETILKYQLDGVQLHGSESFDYCNKLRALDLFSDTDKKIEIIKVFSVDATFDFSSVEEFEDLCDYFLFDTKGELPGGNGYAFDWMVLEHYPSTKPFFLSGGIGLDSLEALMEFTKSRASTYCHAVDVNSKFEETPGKKNIGKLNQFKELLQNGLSR